MHRRVPGLLLSFLLVSSTSKAGAILQDESFLAMQVLSASPIGQTFTAESERVSSIAFFFRDFNSELPNGLTTITLYDGPGTSGGILHRESLTIPPLTTGFVDFDFRSVTLQVGDVYTAIVERENARWAVLINQFRYTGDGSPIPGRTDYVGGQLVFGGNLEPFRDLRFRVTPIPEPSSLLLGAMAGVGLLVRRRR